jgi:hypothetical protein
MTFDVGGQLDETVVLPRALSMEPTDEGVNRYANSRRELRKVGQVNILRVELEETNLRNFVRC